MIETTTPLHTQDEPELLADYGGWPVYPMPMFITIRTPDVTATAEWFRDALGFGVMFVGPPHGDEPAMIHVRRSRYQDVLITAADDVDTRPDPSMTVTFQALTDTEVDAIAERAASHGDVHGPYHTPWNTREVTVDAPTGHRFVFSGRRTDVPTPGFDEIMKPAE